MNLDELRTQLAGVMATGSIDGHTGSLLLMTETLVALIDAVQAMQAPPSTDVTKPFPDPEVPDFESPETDTAESKP
jgi:hypothetical protein